MLISKNTTLSSNTSLERSTPQQTNYHAHQIRTKGMTTIKTKPSSNQNSSSILLWHKSRTPQKETSWLSSTITLPQDIQDEMRQSKKLSKSYHGRGCGSGSQTM